jgi:hypothetical protein
MYINFKGMFKLSFKIKFIPRGLPREQSDGGLPRGRSAALPLGQARGSYPGRSQKIDYLLGWIDEHICT